MGGGLCGLYANFTRLAVANMLQDLVAQQAVSERVKLNVNELLNILDDMHRDDLVALTHMNFNLPWMSD